ncbi:DUF6443 domain-containing protein, partial [Pedobacter sp.]|uniref:DUF6443 domain-containing protein n=1 Tax=Pedobacter sp. TaxID=1411316 RepID=UPI002C7E396D
MKRYILLLLILSWSIFGLNAQTGLKKFTPSGGENFVVETVVKQAGFTQASQLDYMGRSIATRKITYLDDFGRAKQTVDWQSSFGGKDLININVYDPLGRQTKVFLPITGAGYGQYIGGNGEANVKEFYSPLNPEDVNVTPTNFPFSPQVYENSPIDLVLEKGAPGDAWQILNTPGAVNSGHTIKTDYGTNVSATEVKLWTISGSSCSLNGFYALNALYKVVIKDENGNEQTTYKDKRGKVILKRNNDGASQLDTYYVYDELGNNRYVIPPGFTGTSFTDNDASFNAFIYAYKYDDRNRVIEKKLPGKGWDYIVYNKLDQVVATQDAVQRAKSAQEWLISKYDVFGRVILTGVYTYPSSVANTSYRAALQATVDGQSVFQESRVAGSDYSNQSWPVTGITTTLSVNYYDNYSIPGLPVDTVYNFGLGDKYSKMTKTLLTVSKINVLGTAQMLWKVSYYDDEGRVVRNIIQHFKGGVVAGNNYDDIYNTYNFSHELITSIRRHYVNGTEQLYLANRFTYDTQGRPQDIYQKTGDNISTTNPEILLSRKNYNEVGQLTSKQLHSSNISLPSFAQTINYSYNPRGWLKIQSAPLFTENLKHEETITGVTSQYNGNISRQEWGSGKYFNYSYDKLSRLNFALSSEGYNELIGYDGMGNITRLQRKQAGTLVDQLKYTYNGSQLSSVLDSNTVSTSAAFQLPGTTNYTYDVNGNMLSRGNSLSTANNLSSITYNYLNLPNGMTAGTAAMTYTYDATGNKLRKQVPSASINIDYISGIQYEGGVLKYVSNGEGRVVRNSATNYSYEYTLADHLGNGRVYFDINAGAARKIQETDYYAFGLDIQRSIIGTENKYQF